MLFQINVLHKTNSAYLSEFCNEPLPDSASMVVPHIEIEGKGPGTEKLGVKDSEYLIPVDLWEVSRERWVLPGSL